MAQVSPATMNAYLKSAAAGPIAQDVYNTMTRYMTPDQKNQLNAAMAAAGYPQPAKITQSGGWDPWGDSGATQFATDQYGNKYFWDQPAYSSGGGWSLVPSQVAQPGQSIFDLAKTSYPAGAEPVVTATQFFGASAIEKNGLEQVLANAAANQPAYDPNTMYLLPIDDAYTQETKQGTANLSSKDAQIFKDAWYYEQTKGGLRVDANGNPDENGGYVRRTIQTQDFFDKLGSSGLGGLLVMAPMIPAVMGWATGAGAAGTAAAAGTSAADIAAAAGIPELGLIADNATLVGAMAGGISAADLAAMGAVGSAAEADALYAAYQAGVDPNTLQWDANTGSLTQGGQPYQAPGTTTTPPATDTTTPPATDTTTPPATNTGGTNVPIDWGDYVSPEITGMIANNETLLNAVLGGVPIMDLISGGAVNPLQLLQAFGGDATKAISAITKLISGSGSGGSGTGTGGSGGLGDWLPAVIGAIIGGTQNQTAPIQTDVTPWNADFLNAGQNAALNLMNNNPLTLPEVPNLPTMDDAFIQQAIGAATEPMYHDFLTKVMPAIRSDFGDAYGSTRQDIAYGLGMDALQRNVGNTSAQISSALYPSVFNSQVNAVQWPYEQKAAQATQLWGVPWQNVTNAANVFTGAAGKGNVATTQMPDTPWWQTAAGGAAAAQGVWDKIFGNGGNA